MTTSDTDLLLDVAVGVVDDGQEHVEEDKEHEEEVGHEEDGAQDSGKKLHKFFFFICLRRAGPRPHIPFSSRPLFCM